MCFPTRELKLVIDLLRKTVINELSSLSKIYTSGVYQFKVK